MSIIFYLWFYLENFQKNLKHFMTKELFAKTKKY